MTNSSNVALTGIVVRDEQRRKDGNGKLDHYGRAPYDSLLNPGQPSLAPGQSHTFELGPGTEGDQPLQLSVEAAIFADGAAEGTPEGIKYLWSRRQWLATGYEEALHDLDTALGSLNDRKIVVAALTQLEKSKIEPHAPIEKRLSFQLAYGRLIADIRNSGEPPARVIEEERPGIMAEIKAIRSHPVPAQVQR